MKGSVFESSGDCKGLELDLSKGIEKFIFLKWTEEEKMVVFEILAGGSKGLWLGLGIQSRSGLNLVEYDATGAGKIKLLSCILKTGRILINYNKNFGFLPGFIFSFFSLWMKN